MLMISPTTNAQDPADANESQASGQACVISPSLNITSDPQEWTDATHHLPQSSLVDVRETSEPLLQHDIGTGLGPTDIWSAAFREAINTLEPKIDTAQITGKSVEQLFVDLRSVDKSINEESTVRRGLEHLRSVKTPLENFKLALDLANPFVSFEPTAATVIGVLRGVTTAS